LLAGFKLLQLIRGSRGNKTPKATGELKHAMARVRKIQATNGL